MNLLLLAIPFGFAAAAATAQGLFSFWDTFRAKIGNPKLFRCPLCLGFWLGISPAIVVYLAANDPLLCLVLPPLTSYVSTSFHKQWQ